MSCADCELQEQPFICHKDCPQLHARRGFDPAALSQVCPKCFNWMPAPTPTHLERCPSCKHIASTECQHEHAETWGGDYVRCTDCRHDFKKRTTKAKEAE